MSNVGVHDFAIPHEFARPVRDLIVIRLPLPPRASAGGIKLPDMFRDMAQYNVMAGRIVSMGPLAFSYKDGSGNVAKEDVKVGDWVEFRPYAGTQTIGGKVTGLGNWRYLSTFQDVIAVLPADKMPDPATLIWDDEEEAAKPAPAPKAEFGGQPRETIKTNGAVQEGGR